MKENKRLLVATYNIQFCLHPSEVIENILEMTRKGVTVFCLQEVYRSSGNQFAIDVLLTKLGKDWKAICHLGKEDSMLAMGNCVLWNTKTLALMSEERILLPKSEALAIHEKVFSWIVAGITSTFQRRVIIAYFKFGNKHIRVTNVHLDHNGGLKNRKKQLLYILNVLRRTKLVNHEVLCGDFNSFDLLRRGKEAEMYREVIGDYFTDASKDSGWTADLNDLDVREQFSFFKHAIKIFNIHVRRKIDYIWVRNLKINYCEKLLKKGSDHNPLIVSLTL